MFICINYAIKFIYTIQIIHALTAVLTTFPSASLLTLLGGSLFFLSSLDLTLTILEWIAQATQWTFLSYILGMTNSLKAKASLISF